MLVLRCASGMWRSRDGKSACIALLCLGCGRTTLNASGSGDTASSDCDRARGCAASAERLLQAQHFESTAEVSLRDISAGGDGRVGIGGYYKGSLRSGGAGPSLADASTEDGFVAVYDANGHEQWALPLPGFGSQGVTGVAFAPNGDLAAQAFSDPKREALLGSASGTAFVIRFDAAGEVSVRKGFSGARTFAAKVAVDNTGAWIAVGSFTGQFDFYGLRPTLPPYVVKLDAGGNLIWLRDLAEVWAGQPGLGADSVGPALENLSVAVDAQDAIAISGDVQLDQHSAFLVKLDADGALDNYTFFGGNLVRVRVNGVAVDRDGAAIVAGDFFGDWQLGAERLVTAPNSAASDAWVAKLSRAGGLQWVKTFSGNGVGSGAQLTAVAADADGNVVVAGTADSIAIEDETFTRRDAASQVAFVAKLSPNGDKSWVYRANCQSAHFFALALDARSNIWAGGEFDGELDFGSTPTAALGHPDGFLFQLRR